MVFAHISQIDLILFSVVPDVVSPRFQKQCMVKGRVEARLVEPKKLGLEKLYLFALDPPTLEH